MSVNTAHTNKGVLIYARECIILYCENISIEFPGQLSEPFCGLKSGYLYLTLHRMLFRNKKQLDMLQSLSFPYIALYDVNVPKKHPLIRSDNSISGKLVAQRNGNFTGQLDFKIFFKSFETAKQFGEFLFCAVALTVPRAINPNLLPPYKPSRELYEPSLEAYKCPTVFKKWLPINDEFKYPLPNAVFMCDNLPPFPGIDPYKEFKLSSKLATTESSDGFNYPPIYGIVKHIYKDGCVFPHQATVF